MNPHKIIRAVEKYYYLPANTITGTNRSRTRVEARAVAAHLCRRHTIFNKSELAEIFKKDHTTIINLLKKDNDRIRNSIQSIELLIYNK